MNFALLDDFLKSLLWYRSHCWQRTQSSGQLFDTDRLIRNWAEQWSISHSWSLTAV